MHPCLEKIRPGDKLVLKHDPIDFETEMERNRTWIVMSFPFKFDHESIYYVKVLSHISDGEVFLYLSDDRFEKIIKAQ